jgi:23S rRNA (guanosine2251-2'-O)-methyltransferase
VILYGRNPVMEALRGRRARTVREVWATRGAAREAWLAGVSVRTASAEEIERRCGSASHQGLCASVGDYPYADDAALLALESPLLVALDQVQDPQNLGSICRTAECAGAAGVVIPERRAAEVTPAVCKASAGAVEHLPIARVRNLADFLIASREAGCWSYGASAPEDASGERGADTDRERLADAAGYAESRVGAARARGTRIPVAYDAPDYRGGVVLVLGSEGDGLRPRVAAACDELITLPLRGRIDSLGVSAAAAAILYEILHNRRRALDKAP